MKLTTKERLQNKINCEVGKSKGILSVSDVWEIMDEMNCDINLTNKQIANMIKKAKDSYGY